MKKLLTVLLVIISLNVFSQNTQMVEYPNSLYPYAYNFYLLKINSTLSGVKHPNTVSKDIGIL